MHASLSDLEAVTRGSYFLSLSNGNKLLIKNSIYLRMASGYTSIRIFSMFEEIKNKNKKKYP